MSKPFQALAYMNFICQCFRFDENGQILCDSTSCGSKKKNNIVIPIAASIGGLVFLFVIVSAIFLLRRKKQNQGTHFEYTDTEYNLFFILIFS